MAEDSKGKEKDSALQSGWKMLQKGSKRWVRREGGEEFEKVKRAFSGPSLKPLVESGLRTKFAQEKGADYVVDTISEGVSEVKTNFTSILKGAREKAVEGYETRNVYENAKKLLKADEGKWYAKLGKRAAARVLTWSLPVLSYVSAGIAGKLTGKQDPDNLGRYKGEFNGIYNGLIARFAGAKTAAPAAPAAAPSSGA